MDTAREFIVTSFAEVWIEIMYTPRKSGMKVFLTGTIG